MTAVTAIRAACRYGRECRSISRCAEVVQSGAIVFVSMDVLEAADEVEHLILGHLRELFAQTQGFHDGRFKQSCVAGRTREGESRLSETGRAHRVSDLGGGDVALPPLYASDAQANPFPLQCSCGAAALQLYPRHAKDNGNTVRSLETSPLEHAHATVQGRMYWFCM